MKLTITPQFKMYLASLHISLDELLEKANLPHLLCQDKLSLNTQQYYRLLQIFDQTISDHDLIQLAKVNNLSTFVPPIYAALSAQNGSQALERFSLFKKIIGPVVLTIQRTRHATTISFSYATNDPLPRFALMQEQLLLLDLVRTGTGKQITPLMVSGPFDYSQQISDVFNVKPEFDALNMMVLSNEDLETPFLTQNNVMWEYLAPGLNQHLAQINQDTSFRETVEALLVKKIPSGSFSISAVAASLVISVRTLQRNLHDEDVTFNQLVKNTQKLLSFNFLSQKNLSLEEIAYLVGYTDVSSFSRAFKRWSGTTISAYRKNLKH